MAREKGSAILTELERRFGKVVLPQMLRWIAAFQALAWALSLFSPALREWLLFDRARILGGEIWRLVSWVFFPVVPGDFHPITAILFVVIALLFFFFISDHIESAWNPFRTNLYAVTTIVLITLVGMLPLAGLPATMMTSVFFSSIFLAFCTLFPDQIIHLFAIIPIKAKWLGLANAALLFGAVLTSAALLPTVLLVAIGLLPYFVVFVPGFSAAMKSRGETAVRRHRFEGAHKSESEAFHVCASCGATEIGHPEREFRVSADGEEYCSECRPPN